MSKRIERIRLAAEAVDLAERRGLVNHAALDLFQVECRAENVLRLCEYVQASEALIAASNLVFENRADPASLATPMVRMEKARRECGCPHEANIIAAGEDA